MNLCRCLIVFDLCFPFDRVSGRHTVGISGQGSQNMPLCSHFPREFITFFRKKNSPCYWSYDHPLSFCVFVLRIHTGDSLGENNFPVVIWSGSTLSR